jgi:hypothetical protein
MNVFECFPSKWIKAADLAGSEHDLTIDRVELERLDEQTIKPVVFFVGHQKGLMLNRTNASTVADLYSPETEKWHGQRITIYPTVTDYRGVSVECIRVRKAAPMQPLEAIATEESQQSRLVLPVSHGNGSSASF